MSQYSKTNLLKIDNSSQTKGVEAYFSRKFIDSKELGVSLFRYAANFQSKVAHSHEVQEEAYVVVGGSGRILIDDHVESLGLWDVVRLAPEVVRAFEGGPEGLDIIAVGGHKPEGGDGVRHEASWPKD